MMPLHARKEALKTLEHVVLKSEDRFFKALKEDLGRSSFETYVTEVALIKEEISLARKSLTSWAKAKSVRTPLVFQPGSSFIEPIPKGVVLIISPWNYPLQLALLPLVSAIAAGNCAIIKPSEHAPASAEALSFIVNEHLDPSCFRVIKGAREEAEALLNLPFDHIFYTGGAQVAHEVMKRAAINLTPTTLELGGKSPCIIDKTANLKLAAKRIWWAKCLNAGQTCVAPDYVLIDHSLKDDFIAQSASYFSITYNNEVRHHENYARIVNERHMNRLVQYLHDGHIVYGGRYDVKERFFEPTLLDQVPLDAPVMKEEIFGPILPIISVDGIDEAVAFINLRPNPLALYLFSENKASIEKIRMKTSSGGLSINECLSHAAILKLPFGGIGPSGMGNYHGEFGFMTFSHLRAVHKRANILDNPLKYPPYSDQKLNLARLVM